MNSSELLQQASKLNVARSGDKRSPHKPLLILLTLGRIQLGKARLATYEEIEEKLVRLLSDFGPVSARKTPQLPFWHLQSDGFWEIPNPEGVLTPSGSVSVKALRDNNVLGGFTVEAFNLLKADPQLIQQLGDLILETHFPPSLRQEILDEAGLDFEASLSIPSQKKAKRDPAFRRRIMEAYEHRCAICDFSVRMENTPIALEAAHIKWFQVGGPDIETNGLALCALHHKLLDRGAIAINEDLKIIVSEKANGHAGFQEWVLDFDGKQIRAPRNKKYHPNPDFLEWHIREVFQSRYNA